MKKRGKQPEIDWEDENQEEIIWVRKAKIKRDAEQLKKTRGKIGRADSNQSGKNPIRRKSYWMPSS